MRKLLIISVLFFAISNPSFSQENSTEINRLVNTISKDSIVNKLMNNFITQIINDAKKQIRGAGAKEKFESYSNFIKKESDALSQNFTNSAIPETYKQHFTPNEINDITAFYETTTGKKFLFQMVFIMESLKLVNIQNPETYSNHFTPNESNVFNKFVESTSGTKLFQELTKITSELMTSLFMNYIPDFQKKLKKELARLDSKIWREAYRVKPEQVTIYKGDFTENRKLIRIKNDKKVKETLITFAVPIYDNKWWIRFDKNIEIIDLKSDKHYQVLRLDKDLILNKTMIVSDQKMTMIEVTLVFPLLKRSVKKIDILQEISEDADLMSNNGGGDGSISRNIKIKDYLVK